MNRTQLINNILQQRLPLAKNIERVENILRQKRENLKNLEQLRLGILPKIDNSNLISTLRKVDLKPLQNTIETELNSLSKLKRRFKKHTLNIGVVGRARQGKSRLLQSISGLTAAEIPDGDGEHCTGVRSTIYNLPPEKGEAYGVVFFHTESSFVKEVITPYFKQLRLVNYPQNMNDFANSNLPELPNELKNFAEYKAKYE
ncbi:MAG: hypothetical protein SAK42_19805, partial [Oscillatoria sp. PMC 1076.18]|nr:hypothetical protein [Oscillatoria sp. PMC 1076.18]